MYDGYTTDPSLLISLLKKTEAVNGDIAEIGVFRGHKYLKFLELAERWKKKCHAFDSFVGMDEPTEYDRNYPKGKFNVGGAGNLRVMTRNKPLAIIHEGFIPEILVNDNISELSFVHIDVDQYRPTVDAMNWAWPKLSPGGVMVCHDYVESNCYNCTVAYKKWMEENRTYDGLKNTWVWWIKAEGE
jgi:hypothetical protein